MPGEPQGEREAVRHLFDAVVNLFEALRPTGRDHVIERHLLDAWEIIGPAPRARGVPDAEPTYPGFPDNSHPNPPEVL